MAAPPAEPAGLPEPGALLPALIGGRRIERRPFAVRSLFYPDYLAQAADASPLDVAAAIGAARSAQPGSLAGRIGWLNNAARAFQAGPQVIAHTVRMTGLPLQVVAQLLADIPAWLSSVPQAALRRYPPPAGGGLLSEELGPRLRRLLIPIEGFCYAVLPANDPRAAALVAASLGVLGIPFILKASKGDAVSLRVVQALIAGGFDPDFCSLLYFDNRRPDAPGLHARLVEASAAVWTFGPQAQVDRALRFAPGSAPADLFAGKPVLYHQNAACAAIVGAPWSPQQAAYWWEALSFASGCTASRSAMVVRQPGWLEPAAAFLQGLVIGDPLDPATQVGYLPAANLDYLESLLRRHQASLERIGGRRISAFQMSPALLTCQDGAEAFFQQEIPAYLLAVRHSPGADQAARQLNQAAGGSPRLAVSIYGFPPRTARRLAGGLHAQVVTIDQPTTRVIPFFHEGNDYLQALTRPRLIAG
jgi:acyl-CoA reductase-like NAD-dependent aldehyde dehydrogenase